MELNKIYNEDCFITMKKMEKENYKVDNILTSPFYNTCRSSKYHTSLKSRNNHEGRYDIHLDNMSDQQYIDFTIELFDNYDEILKENGCIIYNLSYSSENTHLMWQVVSSIISNTNFTVADDIIWKKSSALPNNVSSNKLTRIVEHIFIFCRKNEFKTFKANKKVKSIGKNGQKYYENIFNYIEAPNNDGSNNLNKATFSSELVKKLLNIYVTKGSVVYDSFMGTGTTAVGCKEMDINYIGSEISKAQCDFANKRIEQIHKK